MKKTHLKKALALILAGAMMLMVCACKKSDNTAKQTSLEVSPEEFAKEFILASNKPDSLAVDNYTLGGGEISYKYEAKAANKSEKDYYMSISDNKATDYASYINYQNDHVLAYWQSLYGATDMKTEIGKVTAKKLDSKKLAKVRKYFEGYDYITTENIYEAYKVDAKFKTTIGGETKDNELFLLILNYDGQPKFFVSTESEEEFDNGFN